MKQGAEILIDTLIEEGVDVIFGYQGGAVLPIFDLLYRTKELKVVLVRHEQAAAHAADGYARETGKVGVCLATSGPGATNLVTGIATAYMDSIPIVALTGQVPSTMIGNDAFQEADIVGITRPITKQNYLVKSVEDLGKIVKEAFYLARSGRPGPVLIDIPKDVSTGKCKSLRLGAVSIRSYNPTHKGHPLQIKKAAEAIAKAKRPVIYAGGGVILSNAADKLKELAEKTQIPVTNTLMGLGGFPGTHPLSLGMLGMHGTKYANFAISEADLLIAIGARFDDRITGKMDEFAKGATIIHIDIDPSEISKNIKCHIPIVGDVGQILEELNKIAEPPEISEWLSKIFAWKKGYPLTYKDDDQLRPQYVIEKIYELTNGEAIITTEVGQNQMWAAQYYKFDKPRRFLSSGGLGTMGYGFPAAIGAQVANPKATVFDIAGDGSIQMNIQELATCVQEKLPVKIAILNNQYLGMVRQWQELFYDKRYSHTDISVAPDFVKLAEAYGILGIRVEKKEEVTKAIKEAIAYKGPALLDFRIVREENVFPMVPAGAALTQMMDGIA
ncbi:MAG: biosynthetic-type acetolactate synthase large subunit [bacterium]|nr:biosynthetic-type acetolactate synthase large subunit [bacterium]